MCQQMCSLEWQQHTPWQGRQTPGQVGKRAEMCSQYTPHYPFQQSAVAHGFVSWPVRLDTLVGIPVESHPFQLGCKDLPIRCIQSSPHLPTLLHGSPRRPQNTGSIPIIAGNAGSSWRCGVMVNSLKLRYLEGKAVRGLD